MYAWKKNLNIKNLKLFSLYFPWNLLKNLFSTRNEICTFWSPMIWNFFVGLLVTATCVVRFYRILILDNYPKFSMKYKIRSIILRESTPLYSWESNAAVYNIRQHVSTFRSFSWLDLGTFFCSATCQIIFPTTDYISMNFVAIIMNYSTCCNDD